MSDVEVKSYRYLRTAMVGLLVGLGAAVIFQTWRQGSFLASVSAYYYTPAQAILVGALVGLGACMIALKGTNVVEEVFLNLGGMFAAVVAIVPTSRGQDYETAVRACEQAGPLLTERASTGLDCPTVRALAEATRANVENNMVALVVVGVLGLVAALLFALSDGGAPGSRLPGAGFWWGFGAALLVVAAGAVALWKRFDELVSYGHYVAAVGLLCCVLIVIAANAVRRGGMLPGRRPYGSRRRTLHGLHAAGYALVRRPDRYAVLAWVVLAVAGLGLALLFAGVITAFWLEIAVALLFAVFWMVQTIERWGSISAPGPSPTNVQVVTDLPAASSR